MSRKKNGAIYPQAIHIPLRRSRCAEEGSRIGNTRGCADPSAKRSGRRAARRFCGKVRADLRSFGERTPLACCFESLAVASHPLQRWLAQNEGGGCKTCELR